MTQDETTHYLENEGKDSMRDCIALSIAACVRAGINKLVIFTATGDGPRYAAKEFLPLREYQHLQIVAVTPPVGKSYFLNPADKENSPVVRTGINPAVKDDLWSMGIEIVSAHLPFQEREIGSKRSSEWTPVAEAYGVLGGGFSFCVQALLVACDAGAVQMGERVMVVSADTAFIAVASRTESFLSSRDGMLVEHIVCRPQRYGISKRNHGSVNHTWGKAPSIVLAPQEERRVLAQPIDEREPPPSEESDPASNKPD